MRGACAVRGCRETGLGVLAENRLALPGSPCWVGQAQLVGWAGQREKTNSGQGKVRVATR